MWVEVAERPRDKQARMILAVLGGIIGMVLAKAFKRSYSRFKMKKKKERREREKEKDYLLFFNA